MKNSEEPFGKIKGAPVLKADCVKAEEIKGKKPCAKLNGGRSTENAFAVGKIS